MRLLSFARRFLSFSWLRSRRPAVPFSFRSMGIARRSSRSRTISTAAVEHASHRSRTGRPLPSRASDHGLRSEGTRGRSQARKSRWSWGRGRRHARGESLLALERVEGRSMLAGEAIVSYVTSTNDNGSYKAGSAITIEVVFDKNVLVGGSPRLELAVGGATTAAAVFQSAQGSSLKFLYAPQTGATSSDLDYVSTTALKLNGGVILTADGSGAALLTLPSPGIEGSLGYSKNIVIDTNPPAAPTVTPLTTASRTPTLEGTATLLAGETLSVAVNGVTFNNVPVTTGNWSLNTRTASPASGTFADLADGTYSVTATVTDQAGNASPDPTINELTIDTVPPAAPVVDSIVTKAKKPLLTGTATLADAESLKVTVNGFTFENVPVIAGKWTLNTSTASPSLPPFTDLDEGSYEVVATVTDARSNVATSSGQLIVDLTGPTVSNVTSSTADGAYKAGSTIAIQVVFTEPVTIVTTLGSPTLALNAATGRIATYDAVNSSSNIVAFKYTVVAGDNVADLDYTGTTALALNGGSIRDAAGNDATRTLVTPGAGNSLGANKAIVIDTTAPTPAPTVPRKTYNTTLPTIEGTATLGTGEKLTVVVNDATYDNVAVTSDKWSIDTSSLAPSSGTLGAFVSGSVYQVVATVTDAAGNATNDTTINEITINTTVPPAPSVDSLITKNKKPTVTGSATLAAGQTLAVTINGFTFNSVPVAAGRWSLNTGTATPTPSTTAFSDLTDGIYNVIAVVADTAGNSATDATVGELIIDTVAATVISVTSSTPDGAYNASKTISIQIQLDKTVTVVGSPTLALNTTPARNATFVNATAGALGTILNFTYTVVAGDTVADLDYKDASALALNGGTIRDAAGNDATRTLVTPGAGNSLGANKAIVIDTTAPAAPTVTRLVTTSRLPTIQGTATLVFGDSLTVSIRNSANTIVGTAIYENVVVNQGAWSIDLDITPTTSGGFLNPLNNGTYSISATVIDSAGNTKDDATFKELIIGSGIQMVTASVTDGAYRAGTTIPIQILFSEPVTVAVALEKPTLTLALDSGATGIATYESESVTGTRVLVFNYVVQPGHSTVDLDYLSDSAISLKFATVRDANGVDAILTLPAPGAPGSLGANKAIVIDTTAPIAPTVIPLTTNVRRPTITGTATLGAGETLSVTVNGIMFSNVTVSSGNWSLNTATAAGSGTFLNLSDNTYAVTATVTDAAGNVTSDVTTNELVIDTVAPAVPTVNPLITNNPKPTLTGTATLLASEILTVTVNGFTFSGATTGNFAFTGSNWSLDTNTATPTSGTFTNLTDGPYPVTATVTDAATNATSDTTTNELVIDTVPPTVSNVTSSTADGAYKAGGTISIQVQLSENVTVVGSPTLALNVGRNATFVTVTGGNVLNFTYTVVAGDNTADLDYASTTALALNGATIRDTAGNDATRTLAEPGGAGSLGANKAIVIDTTAPTAPTVAILTTRNQKPTLTGTATLLAGEILTVTVNGITFSSATPSAFTFTGNNWSLNTATAAGSGQFPNLTDGTYAVTATVTDAATNVTSDATTNELVIDTVAPAAPTVNPLITNNPKPTITGTATLLTGETLSVTVNGFTFNNVPVTSGNWSLNTGTASSTPSGFTNLTDGTYPVTATVTDAAGNAAIDSTTNELVVDTTAPTVSNVTSSTPDGAYRVNSPISIQVQMSEPVTVAGSPTLALNVGRNATFVNVTGGNVLNFTYTVVAGDNTADLDYASTTALALNGATIRDAAGNDATRTLVAPGAPGSLGANKAIVIDTTAPTAPTVTSLTTNVRKPTLTGTATLLTGETLSVTVNGITFSNVTVTSGAWSLNTATAAGSGTFNNLTDGTYPVTATVTDAAGNATSDTSTNELVIDTVAPTAPTVNPLITNNPKPTITGTATLLTGETLSVTVNGFTFNNVPVTSGNWSLNTGTASSTPSGFTNLTDGTYPVTATVTDAATNATSDTTSNELLVDRTAPSAPTLALGPGVSDPVSRAEALQPSGVVTVSGEAGSVITVTFTRNGSTVTKTLVGTGEPQAVVLTNGVNGDLARLGDGLVTVTAVQTDTAGNPQTVTPATTSFTLDTASAAVTTVTSPMADGTVVAFQQLLQVRVIYNEDVTIDTTGGSPTLSLNTAFGGQAIYVRQHDARTLIFRFTPQLGDAVSALDVASPSALVLNGAVIRDTAGNTATGELPIGSLAAKRIAVDAALQATAQAVGFTPENAPSRTASRRTLTITFNAPVSGVSLSSFKLFYASPPRRPTDLPSFRLVSLKGATVTGSGTTYTLTMPANLTSLRGIYRVDVGGSASGVVSDGIPMTRPTSFFWKRV
jgi:hypothetical protein